MGLPLSHLYDAVLVIVDRLTKYTTYIPISTSITATELLRLVERVLFGSGAMDVVQSLKRLLFRYFAGGELVKLNEEARRTWSAPSS